MSRNRDPNMRIAEEAYDEASAQHGPRFNTEDAVSLLVQRLLFDADHARTVYAKHLIEAVDRNRTRKSPPNQPSLFPLDSFLVIGPKQRVRESTAAYADVVMSLEYEYKNVENVQEQYGWGFKKFVAISPYLQQGLTVGDAIKAFVRDYPDQQFWIA
jgi:hypothetical protein